ncbi:putative membrane protein [Frankia sp. AiPs1]|uniref:PH domain-containing protein n=1 Tax=Frankia sp. AiPa1 TaxID=573492 RepID=UPI00202B085C|nr:PH domain-containing protein [Frankia sp. AiPa1]MCL9761931.1 PH domain-containing protein [Frankia sp. AiPa1]
MTTARDATARAATGPAATGPAVQPRPVPPAPSSLASSAAQPGASDGYHRLHPLTPFLRGWVIVVAFAATVGRNFAEDVTARAIGLTMIFLVPAAGTYGYCAWRFTRYRIDRDGLRLDTGLLMRRTRYVRLDRLQSVDIVQPLLARMVGLAILRLDLAGRERKERADSDGGDSASDLRYLSIGHAQRLRAQLLVGAAGHPTVTVGSIGAAARIGVDGPADSPRRLLAEVPPRRLVAAIALSPAPWLAIFGAAAIAVPSLLTGTRAGVLGAIPLLGWLWHRTIRVFAVGYPYMVSESVSGLRIDSGLLERAHATIPPGRVQAISISEPLLWRPLRWVTIRMNVAGGGPSILLPVARRDEAVALIGALLPGVDVAAVHLARPPRRALALAPVHWWVQACGADERVFVARHGLLRRHTDVIAHGKVQSIRLVANPLVGLLGLADVHLDTTGGPVRVRSGLRDRQEALSLVWGQAERSRLGRRRAGNN